MGPDQLYRLPPEEFTGARDEAVKAAKAAGDAEGAQHLKALRKPTVSAWLVNLLAGEQPELVEQLLALGPALAEAQAAGDGDELRALGAQRRELVDVVVAEAVARGGRSTTPAVREEVATTLETALADPAAADAVRSGRLVRALSYAGFGGVDLDGAVARGGGEPKPRSSKPSARRTDDQAERVAAAEAAALDAAGRLDDAVRACEQAQREQEAARQRADAASAQVEDVRSRLAEAEAAAAQAESQRRKAEKSAAAAVETVRRRQQAEEQARAELDRLRRGSSAG